jgi:hypothetical protein
MTDFYALEELKQAELLVTALERMAAVFRGEQSATFDNLATSNNRTIEDEWADICAACGIAACTIPLRLLDGPSQGSRRAIATRRVEREKKGRPSSLPNKPGRPAPSV